MKTHSNVLLHSTIIKPVRAGYSKRCGNFKIKREDNLPDRILFMHLIVRNLYLSFNVFLYSLFCKGRGFFTLDAQLKDDCTEICNEMTICAHVVIHVLLC